MIEPKVVSEWVGIWGGVLATLHALAALGRWLWTLRRPIVVRVTHGVTMIQGAEDTGPNDVYLVTVTNRGKHALSCNSAYVEWKCEPREVTGLAVNQQILPGDSLPLRLRVPNQLPGRRVRAGVVMTSLDEYWSRWIKTRPNWFQAPANARAENEPASLG